MTIAERSQKIKNFLGEELILTAIIIFIGLASFGLGRLSALERDHEEIKVTYPSKTTQGASLDTSLETKAIPVTSGSYVASKTGTKYYFPWCGSAKNISDTNKIWFKNVEEARAAGYTPAANCKGLK